MNISISRGVKTAVLLGLYMTQSLATGAEQPVPATHAAPVAPAYEQGPAYSAQAPAMPTYQGSYADPAAYSMPQYAGQGYADPAYGAPDYAAGAYQQDYTEPGYQDYGYGASQYPATGYDVPAYQPAQPYVSPQAYDQDYASGGYIDPQQTYAEPGYPAQGYGYPQQDYVDTGYCLQPMAGYPGYAQPYYEPPAARFSVDPARSRAVREGFPMAPPDWDKDDWFGGDNPFQNPADNRGYWADRDFRPWSTGPFGPDEWHDVHPMSNMPWGNFPGWGDGFFGGFGPQSWRGVTPWGNDVPFRWIDPTDPRSSLGDIWDDALNTPNTLGRMPPGWTAPYISVPNPIDVEEEFERNARNFPDEMRKAINTGESDWGGTAKPKPRGGDDAAKQQAQPQEQAKAEAPEPEEDSWVKPMKPITPYSGHYRDAN